MKQKIRVTAILIEDNKILLVKQEVTPDRNWSLPGGTLETGESLENCIVREMEEETGLKISVDKLLYIADRINDKMHVLHITFLVNRISGEIRLGYEPELGANPITDIKMVSIDSLKEYGFSHSFLEIVKQDFPNHGSYVGSVDNIGL